MQNTLDEEVRRTTSARKPLKTSYGSWAKLGSEPAAEEIDENRGEMLPTSPMTFNDRGCGRDPRRSVAFVRRSRLSITAIAQRFFEQAAADGNKIALAAISTAEVAYLVEKSAFPQALKA